MTIKCCKDCVAPKRHPGCHTTCENYLREKELMEKQRVTKSQENLFARAHYDQRSHRTPNLLKRKR